MLFGYFRIDSSDRRSSALVTSRDFSAKRVLTSFSAFFAAMCSSILSRS